MNNLIPPCSYQGGKQRLAKQIVDIIYKENNIDKNTKFFDICCGSGAVSLELINNNFNPNNITMIDINIFGLFYEYVSKNKFDLNIFKEEIDKLPDKEYIQLYLKQLSNLPIDKEKLVYQYLLLQAGSFGSKQIYIKDDKWKNNTFRNYWQPTKNSNRKSPVNPMMPMVDTLFERVENIVNNLSGKIVAYNDDIFNILNIFSNLDNNAIIYIDPPYSNTTKYKDSFDIYELIDKLKNINDFAIYISEGVELDNAKNTYLLSKGRTKGNISGNVIKKPVEEWLNKF
jgi:site-specific DNA-adenine methylase